MTKMAAGLVLTGVAMGAQAADVAWDGWFAMYDPAGAQMDANDGAAGLEAYVTGFIDLGAMTWGVASTTPFFGLTWATSGGTLFGEGTHTVNVNGDGNDAPAGLENVTFTVGAGQLGGNINFAWDSITGIDVFQVWDVSNNGTSLVYTSTDIGGDGILGLDMVDGPFLGFSANFNVTTAVPEASTYAMMLAGLGLVGFAVRRRKLMA
jgi:hypothetical protein